MTGNRKIQDARGSNPIRDDGLDFIRKIADSDKNILLMGETGAGKDFTAKKIHEISPRNKNPFVAISCANIPGDLFEAELFGFVKGAFTGAAREKAGLLEVAGAGTIFLDEIGELPIFLQAKILRAIEDRELRRLGDTFVRKINARFIFATNKDLEEEVKAGRFRKDLYFRICVVKFIIPPLRERKEDIPLLIAHILDKENKKGLIKKEITREALRKIMAYDFPGNIRELENIMERACLLSEGDSITERDIKLNQGLSHFKGEHPGLSSDYLRHTLELCRWNKTRAAREVGKSRRQFYRLLEKHNMGDCIRKKCLF